MKQLYEYTVIWNVKGGHQLATVYVNADTKTRAKKIIKDKLGDKDGFHLYIDCFVYPYVNTAIPDTNILVYYFDVNGVKQVKII